MAGKLRAGVGSLATSFGSFISSPTGAAVAIGAAGAAMFKAVGDAERLGLEVGKLKDATGLSADEASRWIEVADDMGISADTVAGLMTKMEQNVGKNPDKFKELGLQIRYANDGTVDANATLLAAIQLLHDTKDPTEKAALAAQIFGKSWKDAAELIGAGADNVGKKLAAVDKAKLVDDGQIKRARDFRDAMDNLKDVGEDLAITLGQALIPAMTGVAKFARAAIDNVGGLDDKVLQLTGHAAGLADLIELGIFGPLNYGAIESAKAVGEANKEMQESNTRMGEMTRRILAAQAAQEEHKAAIEAVRDELKGSATPALVEYGDANKEAAEKAGGLSQSQQDVARDLDNVRAAIAAADVALQQLKGTLANEEATLAFKSAWSDLTAEVEKTGVVSDATRLRFEGLALSLAGITAFGGNKLKIALDLGDLETAERIVNSLTAVAESGVHIDVRTNMVVGSELRALLERDVRVNGPLPGTKG
jgi:hypothetical protein